MVADSIQSIESRQGNKMTVLQRELPSVENWYHGDFQYFKPDDNRVSSQAVLDSLARVGRTIGLSWTIIYDGEEKISTILEEPDFICLQAKLVPCLNSRGKRVRLLLIDPVDTGMESTRLPLRLDAPILEGKRCFALGPFEHKQGLLARLFSKRGIWELNDLCRVTGVKVSAGDDPTMSSPEFWEARHAWIQQLLIGNRSLIVAGSDSPPGLSHVSRPRADVLPEPTDSRYGDVRTVAYCPGGLSGDSVRSAIRQGAIVVTNGPMITFSMTNEHGETALIGDELYGHTFYLSIEAKSSPEFGDLSMIDVIVGDLRMAEEEIALSILGQDYPSTQDIQISGEEFIILSNLEPGHRGYVRVEAESKASKANGHTYFAMTNAIWFEIPKT